MTDRRLARERMPIMGHTPHKHLTTPWVANGAYVFAGSDCIAICNTDNADEATYEAKARLMAAAPALIAALEGMLQEWDQLTRYGSPLAKAGNERVAAARRALTAAQGASADTGES